MLRQDPGFERVVENYFVDVIINNLEWTIDRFESYPVEIVLAVALDRVRE